ncbi:dihydrolipoamide acetyltransferase family protein [Streptomyces axinellae]|uniref:Dihydrolipoamide acetyltransferase component of pyruvate dehydrogenase complex n=1 Tax=Streptomyces axinellae TaxID=552788 RepID=A0ABP6C890_9ACTN
MPVVEEFRLPDLGEGLTEAQIVRWLIDVGDIVSVDQPVVEVETAKSLMELPCPYEGVITARYGDEGVEIPVGAPLLNVAVSNQPEGCAPGSAPLQEAGSGNVLVGYGTGAPASRRRRIHHKAAADGAHPTEPVAGLRPRERTTPSGVETISPPAVSSPLVRRMAREHGLDLRELTGSGPGGLIVRSDVEKAANSAAAAEPQPGEATLIAQSSEVERIPLRGIHKAMADKVTRSRREIPDATCWVQADATELLAVRAAMQRQSEGRLQDPRASGGSLKVSLLALLARICTAALARYPELNSMVHSGSAEIVRLPAVHIGFAAQTDRGLVVPVVRDAHTRNTGELAAEIARLTEAARDGTLRPTELTGGTFTLNNYGVFGVDGSTPIINHPEVAMLGVGQIANRPWVHNGELAVRRVVQLSLTFDHRACDGATAGGFLRYVADAVEQPALLLHAL